MNLLDGLTRRRKIFKKTLLTHDIYLLERFLIDDGYGVSKEVFLYKGTKFKGRPQPIFRRPDGTYEDAIVEMGDLRIVYDAEVTLDQANRIQIGKKIYTIRNAYDNVIDAMTNQCYASIMSGDASYPPAIQ